jgi:ATP-dependent Zn protease
MGGTAAGLEHRDTGHGNRSAREYSPAQLETRDRRVAEILQEARSRAAEILLTNRTLVETLRDLLLEHKVIDAKTLGQIKPTKAPGNADRPSVSDS